MAERTKQIKDVHNRIPYSSYRNSVYWKIVYQAISNLVRNQDIEEKTSRRYIVGYLVKKIEENS